jgi:superfamily II DNA or RNA helicase
MAISTRGVSAITDLMTAVDESPDFSFLNDWQPTTETSFFPRVNNDPDVKLNLDGEDRQKLKAAITAVQAVNELLEDTGQEMSDSKGVFSNSISVFHRDGELSIVAIPVTATTERAMGGFLLAHDLWGIPNAEMFIDDLKNLSELIPPTEKYLKWRWWPVEKDDRKLNLRSAAQLLLTATNPGNRNIHIIADLMESRASLSAGRRAPQVEDWQLALTKLESLKDFPREAVVVTLDVDQMPQLQEAVAIIGASFERQESLNFHVKEDLEDLIEKRTLAHVNSLTIADFATKVKGQGFARALLISRFNDYAGRQLEPDDQIPTVGSLLRLAERVPKAFDTQSLMFSMRLLSNYVKDQKLLRSYPRLTDGDAQFEEFLRKIYKLYRDQTRPYPARAQYDALVKLIAGEPEQLHLVARSEDSVKHLIGSLDTYTDKERLDKLAEVYEEPTVADAREFFRENPATYQAILSSMGFNSLTLEQISGFLAPELTSTIRSLEIDVSGMKTPLRSYQTFGVQYALHQKRVIIGDEMGLGKTVMALALAKHLENSGHDRFLIVVPLIVLENWRRETAKFTDFDLHVLYGEELNSSLETWVRSGGLAIATFESLQKVNASHLVSGLTSLDLVIVDEAHYIKNPETRRTRAVLPWLMASERALLMTGTALENTLEEFEQIINYVQPNLPMPKDKAIYSEFRKAIAPAYLRRNQVDVLQELPELSDIEEYIELSSADKEYYKRALQTNDWNLARRAKLLAGDKSSTVQRIKSIVAEAMESDNKVLIFSFYLEGIDVLQRALKDDDCYTPLTGALSSKQRQDEVDKFTKADKPGVLLAQIDSGGTGLNIQAASVVILVEPQNKPSREEQALRRAYRMGQTKNVRVIRLRGKDTIDDRWVKMTNEKRKLFNATAGVSDFQMLDEVVAGEQGSLFADEKRAWGVE